MRYVRLLSIVACLATFGFIVPAEVPSVLANDGPDIGIVEHNDQVPEGKADTLVVYSATWCRPCVAMRPQWTLLRSQGYKIVYINIDDPHKYDGRWEYQTKALVEKLAKDFPESVPTVRWYNSRTEKWVGDSHVGYINLADCRKRLWKTSSSKVLVPELLR